MTSVSYPTPQNDAERVRELHQYDLLDTGWETRYESLAYLASEICETPMAAVTLVEDDRQWLKAKWGLPFREIPREHAFCSHAICGSGGAMVVPDASKDDRFADNPLVTSYPGVRFYAGYPLETTSGWSLGTVCVLDTVPRELDPHQVQALEALGDLAVAAIESRQLAEDDQAADADPHRKDDLFEDSLYLFTRALRDELPAVLSNRDLARLAAEALDVDVADHLGPADESSEDVEGGVSDILRYAEAGEAPILRESMDLRATVAEVEDGLEPEIREADADVSVEEPVRLVADQALIQQVLRTLVQNALDHGGESPTILVRGEALDDGWRVEVEDDGPGVPAQDRDRIFGLFERGSNAEETGGTGAGLAICRRIVERHGGDLDVDPAPGGGSVFWFTLPEAEATATEAERPSEPVDRGL